MRRIISENDNEVVSTEQVGECTAIPIVAVKFISGSLLVVGMLCNFGNQWQICKRNDVIYLQTNSLKTAINIGNDHGYDFYIDVEID